MKKPRKKTAEPVRWAVYIMRSKPTYLGTVEARDEAEAMARAIRDLNIRPADHFRISVRRE